MRNTTPTAQYDARNRRLLQSLGPTRGMHTCSVPAVVSDPGAQPEWDRQARLRMAALSSGMHLQQQPLLQQQVTPLGAQLQSLLAGAASAGPPSSRLPGSWWAADAFSAEAQMLPPFPPLDLRDSGSLAGTSSSRVSVQTEVHPYLLPPVLHACKSPL